MFDRVLGPPEGRPTAWDLLEEGLRRRNPVRRAADSSALIAGRERFLQARQRRHPGAPEPPGFNEDIDWMGDPGGGTRPSAPGTAGLSAASSTTSADGTSAYATGQAEETRTDDGTGETAWFRQYPWRRGD
jgi:hypothetical protein